MKKSTVTDNQRENPRENKSILKNKFIEKSIWEIGPLQDVYENKEKFLTFTRADITPKNKTAEYFQIFQQLFITGSSYSEIELVKKGGSLVDTDLNAVLLPNGWVYGSCRNISKPINRMELTGIVHQYLSLN